MHALNFVLIEMLKSLRKTKFALVLLAISNVGYSTSSEDYETMRKAVDISKASYCDNSDIKECTPKELKTTAPVNVFFNDSVTLPVANTPSTVLDEKTVSPTIKDINHYLQEENTLSRVPLVSQTVAVYDDITNTVYIGIRGTKTLAALFLDVNIQSRGFYGDSSVAVHSGLDQYLIATLNSTKIEDNELTLYDWISNLERDKKPNYVISGHSLGGAAAIMLSAYLHSQLSTDADRITTVTFGQPAVGLWDFVSKYRPVLQNYTRVVNIGNPDKLFNSVYRLSSVGDPVAIIYASSNYQHFGNRISVAIDKNDDLENKMPSIMPKSLKYTVGLHSMLDYHGFILGCDLLDPNTQCQPMIRL